MPHIFLLAGPPAVGKSTTARALAAHFEKSIHIPVDDLRDMVISGLALPGGAWDEKLVEQLLLARESAAHMALAYRQAGFTVAIDDFWDPNSRLLEYSRLLQEPQVHRVLLFPSQRAAEERNRKRDGSAYIADGIRLVYENLADQSAALRAEGWLIVDTTDKNVEATVKYHSGAGWVIVAVLIVTAAIILAGMG